MKIEFLYNPFNKIAGGKALLLGLVIIILTSLTGYYSGIHFPGILSVKTCPQLPIVYFLIQGVLNLAIVSIVFYLAALLFSPSKVRLIDVLGTLALARSPYLLAAFTGFPDSLNQLGYYIQHTFMKVGEPVTLSTFDLVSAIILTIVTLLLVVWVVALMFNALKVAANLKGGRLTGVFIPSLIISIIIGIVLNYLLIKNFAL
ncbi:MAG: YIP1 family protein [Carboxylicivirga sp.]|jgi:hypothetical protein|nr:YIP1 family protein [Carboxylicivirga sp.]